MSEKRDTKKAPSKEGAFMFSYLETLTSTGRTRTRFTLHYFQYLFQNAMSRAFLRSTRMCVAASIACVVSK